MGWQEYKLLSYHWYLVITFIFPVDVIEIYKTWPIENMWGTLLSWFYQPIFGIAKPFACWLVQK